MKTVTMILKDSLEHLTPILSLCCHLSDLGFGLTVICDRISGSNQKMFQERGIKVILLPQPVKLPAKLGTICRWAYFHRYAWEAITANPADIYWIGSADTALALGKRIWNFPYILHVNELYDTCPFYRKRLGNYMRRALKVFTPEETRAHIFRAWYQLQETPVVLPNKPYGHPRKRHLPISDPAAAEAFSRIPQDAKKLFYQGWFDHDRDFTPIAKIIQEFDGEIVMVVQGQTSHRDFYEKLCRTNCYFIPFVAPPHHLEVTSNMDFGLLTYGHINQNNEFCAPNKIWEYTGFGLPILTNDVYAMKKTLERYRFGRSLNLERVNAQQVREAIQDLLTHEAEYSDTARRFFDGTDNAAIIRNALSSIPDR